MFDPKLVAGGLAALASAALTSGYCVHKLDKTKMNLLEADLEEVRREVARKTSECEEEKKLHQEKSKAMEKEKEGRLQALSERDALSEKLRLQEQVLQAEQREKLLLDRGKKALVDQFCATKQECTDVRKEMATKQEAIQQMEEKVKAAAEAQKAAEAKNLKLENTIKEMEAARAAMEEERKAADRNLLRTQKRLEEVESEEKRNYQVIVSLKEERRELRSRWDEERLQLNREKEALSLRLLSATEPNQHHDDTTEETRRQRANAFLEKT